MSDAIILTIVTGIITLATIYLKSRIDAKALLAAAIAKEEAAKVTTQLDKVEVKIDGRLTELLETTKQLAEAQGLRKGKEEGRIAERANPTVPKPEGEIKIETAKVDITTQKVNLGEKKPKPDDPKKPDKK